MKLERPEVGEYRTGRVEGEQGQNPQNQETIIRTLTFNLNEKPVGGSEQRRDVT